MIEDTLRRYARQDLPPSGLQAADVLVEARRRNRRRARLVGAAAGAAVLATFGAAAVVRTVATTPITAAGTGCVVEQLDIPAGTTGGVVANGIDPSGRYVIGLAGTRAAPQAVLWTGGTVRVLPGAFAPQAVNAAGLVVGFTGPTRVQYGDEKHQRPAVYDGTRLVPLPLPDGGLGGVAYAVNTHGDVLGTVVRADGSSAAVRWRTTGTVAIVSTVAGASGLGLNDDGVAVGFGVPLPHALRWSADGVTTALPVPTGADSATALAAAGDWAVGDAELPPTGNKDDLMARAAVRWNLRTGAVELISGIGGRRVSASGTVAGTTSTDAPALWRNGRIFALPLPPGGTPYSSSVSGITADGHSLVGGVEVSAGAISTSGPAGDPVASDRTVPVVWRGC
ncbi:hypothetical protein GCM10022255_098700 [Dactylosporangium darangshiense]|uniref:Uncharacterized protein n=1 Tax=Dactylosporangium darangshiense TaxID=579108 RepID=A0ABP8DRI1_9ACTN